MNDQCLNNVYSIDHALKNRRVTTRALYPQLGKFLNASARSAWLSPTRFAPCGCSAFAMCRRSSPRSCWLVVLFDAKSQAARSRPRRLHPRRSEGVRPGKDGFAFQDNAAHGDGSCMALFHLLDIPTNGDFCSHAHTLPTRSAHPKRWEKRSFTWHQASAPAAFAR